MINVVSGCMASFSPKYENTRFAWVEVSPRVMTLCKLYDFDKTQLKFKKSLIFETPNKYFKSGKVRVE